MSCSLTVDTRLPTTQNPLPSPEILQNFLTFLVQLELPPSSPAKTSIHLAGKITDPTHLPSTCKVEGVFPFLITPSSKGNSPGTPAMKAFFCEHPSPLNLDTLSLPVKAVLKLHLIPLLRKHPELTPREKPLGSFSNQVKKTKEETLEQASENILEGPFSETSLETVFILISLIKTPSKRNSLLQKVSRKIYSPRLLDSIESFHGAIKQQLTHEEDRDLLFYYLTLAYFESSPTKIPDQIDFQALFKIGSLIINPSKKETLREAISEAIFTHYNLPDDWEKVFTLTDQIDPDEQVKLLYCLASTYFYRTLSPELPENSLEVVVEKIKQKSPSSKRKELIQQQCFFSGLQRSIKSKTNIRQTLSYLGKVRDRETRNFLLELIAEEFYTVFQQDASFTQSLRQTFSPLSKEDRSILLHKLTEIDLSSQKPLTKQNVAFSLILIGLVGYSNRERSLTLASQNLFFLIQEEAIKEVLKQVKQSLSEQETDGFFLALTQAYTKVLPCLNQGQSSFLKILVGFIKDPHKKQELIKEVVFTLLQKKGDIKYLPPLINQIEEDESRSSLRELFLKRIKQNPTEESLNSLLLFPPEDQAFFTFPLTVHFFCESDIEKASKMLHFAPIREKPLLALIDSCVRSLVSLNLRQSSFLFQLLNLIKDPYEKQKALERAASTLLQKSRDIEYLPLLINQIEEDESRSSLRDLFLKRVKQNPTEESLNSLPLFPPEDQAFFTFQLTVHFVQEGRVKEAFSILKQLNQSSINKESKLALLLQIFMEVLGMDPLNDLQVSFLISLVNHLEDPYKEILQVFLSPFLSSGPNSLEENLIESAARFMEDIKISKYKEALRDFFLEILIQNPEKNYIKYIPNQQRPFFHFHLTLHFLENQNYESAEKELKQLKAHSSTEESSFWLYQLVIQALPRCSFHWSQSRFLSLIIHKLDDPFDKQVLWQETAKASLSTKEGRSSARFFIEQIKDNEEREKLKTALSLRESFFQDQKNNF